MTTHDFRIVATRTPVRERIIRRGSRSYIACTRCGHERQIKSDREIPEDGLCKDCLSTDPDVWRLR